MKKRIWIPIVSVLVLLALAIGFLAMAGTIGNCIVARNGSYLIAMENSPIVMGNQTPFEKIFDGLQTGDRILILHDGVEESYPGRTGVYFLLRLPGGSADDIPQQMLNSLTELGWIE